MANVYGLVPSDDLIIQASALPPSLRAAIFTFSVLGVVALSLFLLYRRYPEVFKSVLLRLQQLIFPSGFRREAQLERVICVSCKKGMSLYDPVYVTYRGESFIEGTCSCCGSFVRARLR